MLAKMMTVVKAREERRRRCGYMGQIMPTPHSQVTVQHSQKPLIPIHPIALFACDLLDDPKRFEFLDRLGTGCWMFSDYIQSL